MSDANAVSTRPLVASDRRAWNPLWAGYLTFYETELDPAITELTWARLLDPSEPVGGLVACIDDGVVGICHHVLHRSTWSDGPYCYLEDLFTAPDARGHGVGTALIEATAAAANEAGATALYWQTHETNTTARRLYDRVGRHDGFVIYERDLGAAP